MRPIRINTIIVFWLLALVPTITFGTNYFVKPNGSDLADGLSQSTAWATFENGDSKGIVAAGDTVFVLSGAYNRSSGATLSTSGTAVSPIVYTKLGKSRPVINFGNTGDVAVSLDGSHTVLSLIEIINVNDDAVRIVGDSITLSHCYMTDISKNGVHVFGSHNTVYANVINSVGDRGINNEDAGVFDNHYYNNTIYNCGHHGIELHNNVSTARVINNIIASNNGDGIRAKANIICAFNNVWGNTGSNYANGAADSVGGISLQPRFVNKALGRFDLLSNANEIDAGLDIGYRFNGSAPDMGAHEKYNVYYISSSGDDNRNGRYPDSAWYSIDNGDSTLFPGDTVYVLSGEYTQSVLVTDSGLADDRIAFVGTAASVSINGSGMAIAVLLKGSNLIWQSINVNSATSVNIQVEGRGSVIDNCLISGSAQYGLLVTSTAIQICRNRITGNQNSGLLLSGDSCRIYNNDLYNNALYGIDGLGSSSQFIVNNIFSDDLPTATGLRLNASSKMSYCIFHNLATPFTGGVAFSADLWYEDPEFMDPMAGDFHLGSYSPAINAGIDVGLPFQDGAPDLGAIETGILTKIDIQPILDSLNSDSSYQFDIYATDSLGNPAYPGVVTWSNNFPTGVISSEGLFVPDLVGTGTISAHSNTYGVSGVSQSMTVVPGALAGISVAPNRDTISADSSQSFTATGVDNNGNPLTYPGQITWNVFGGIGNINSSGLFDARRVGVGRISAISDAGASGISDSIFVVPGSLSSISVSPGSAVIELASTEQFIASGLDSDSNFVADLTDSVTWSTDDPGGSVDATGLYTAGNIPSVVDYSVSADYGLFSDQAEVKVVLSNSVSSIRIEYADHTPVGDTTLRTSNDTTALYARAYDSLSVLLGDVVVGWSIAGPDSIGSLSATAGISTHLILTTPGQAYVSADLDGYLTDSTGLITCIAGKLHEIIVSPDTATVAVGDSIIFTAGLFDADGNLPNPNSIPVWSVIGGIGTINVSGKFIPTKTGSGRIVATALGVADTTDLITVLPGTLTSLEVTPDSIRIPIDGVLQFSVYGSDYLGNDQAVGNIVWSVTSPIGSIDSSGIFTPSSVGTTRVIATSALGPVDTSAYLEITAGRLTTLVVSPDSAEVVSGDILNFSVSGSDAFGNPAVTGGINWSVVGSIGDITSEGKFTALTAGLGRIVATSTIDGVTDTNQIVIVTASTPDRISIVPDEMYLTIGDTITFMANAFDPSFNPVDPGVLSWTVIGGIGTIDNNGFFTATYHGAGRISATSLTYGLADTNLAVNVEALVVTPVPIGNQVVHAGDKKISILSFDVTNLFAADKQIDGLTIRDLSEGRGSALELLTNLDSVHLYADSMMDSLLVSVQHEALQETMLFSPLVIPSQATRRLTLRADVSSSPHDADSSDIGFLPLSDLSVVDGSAVSGPDTLNSLGYLIFDGLIANQIPLTTVAIDTLKPADTLVNVMTFSLPRNGYAVDTLQLVSIMIDSLNGGALQETDFDSLVIFADNGDDLWGGASQEVRLGKLAFTGNRWIRSGLSHALSAPMNKLFMAGVLTAQPSQGAVIALGIPFGGIEMASGNDGPIDGPIPAIEAIIVNSGNNFSIEASDLGRQTLIPGTVSGALITLHLQNSLPDSRILDSLIFDLDFYSSYPSTQEQRESEIDSLMLVSHQTAGPQPGDLISNVIAWANPNNGIVSFDCNSFSIGANSKKYLSVTAAINLENARDGVSLELSIPDSGRIVFSPPASSDASYPLINDSAHVIDGFPLANTFVHNLAPRTIFGNSNRVPVLDFDLPGNGFAPDNLRRFRISNVGTLIDSVAISRFQLWHDWNDNGYTANDSLVASLSYSNGLWISNEVPFPLPVGKTRFSVTADVSNRQFTAGTLELIVPVDGVTCWSGMDGPDDDPMEGDVAHIVMPTDRVTVVAIPEASATVYPGQSVNRLLSFALYNGYVDIDSLGLDGLTFTNISKSLSGKNWADSSLAQVALYLDADNNRIFDDRDSLIGNGYFSSGKLKLSGLGIKLPRETVRTFFVSANLSLELIDSDSLAISIGQASDLVFEDTSSISVNGDLPVTSGGWQTVNGSIRDQYRLLNLPPRSVSPGDSDVTLMAYYPASNGNLNDTLNSQVLYNLGSAGSSDIVNMRLYRDANNNLQFDGPDQLAATFSFNGQAWVATGAAIEINRTSSLLLVVADISPSAVVSKTFRAEIRIGGCFFASDNDGPIDRPLQSVNEFVISRADMSVALAPHADRYTVGQTIKHTITVTNIGPTPILDAFGVATIGDSSLVSIDSSFAGPASIDVGSSVDFDFYYTGLATGELVWQFQAVAPSLGDSSALLTSDNIEIQQAPSNVAVDMINSIPTSVTKGQTNIFPMSIVIDHPDTLSSVASIRLDSLTLKIEDGTGKGRFADSTLSRIVLASGYTNLSIMETIPSDSVIVLRFTQPLVIPPSGTKSLSFLVDIDTGAVSGSFALALTGPSSLVMADYNSSNPVSLDPTLQFPMRTAVCRIDSPSNELLLSAESVLAPTVNYGQNDVDLINLIFSHPGQFGTSPVQVTGLTVEFVDSLLNPITVPLLINRVQIRRQQVIVAEVTGFSATPEPVEIELNSPLTLNPSERDSLVVRVSINNQSIYNAFGLLISDSSQFVVRDLSSGSLVDIKTDTTRLATGSVFPIFSGSAVLKQPALQADVCLTSLLPEDVAGGQDSLLMIEIALDYSAPSENSSIVIWGANVNVTDSLSRPLDADRLFDRIGFAVDGQPPVYQPFVQILNGLTHFDFGGGVRLNPGDSKSVQLTADIEADVPFDNFTLMMSEANALVLTDATDSSKNPGFLAAGSCGGLFPFISANSKIFLPAGKPTVAIERSPVQISFKGQEMVKFLDVVLGYDASGGRGDILMTNISAALVNRNTTGWTEVRADQLITAIYVYLNGQPRAADSSGTSTTIDVDFEQPQTIGGGQQARIEIYGNLRPDVNAGNYALRLNDSGFVFLQDKNLLNRIYASSAFNYPQYAGEISVMEADLEHSFANYPNPFHPSRGEKTTIAYVLPSEAYVDIEIFTITGSSVKMVAENLFKTQGAHAEEVWEAFNDRGLEVVSGTYYCRIIARYTSGKTEEFRRKVAVIR